MHHHLLGGLFPVRLIALLVFRIIVFFLLSLFSALIPCVSPYNPHFPILFILFFLFYVVSSLLPFRHGVISESALSETCENTRQKPKICMQCVCRTGQRHPCVWRGRGKHRIYTFFVGKVSFPRIWQIITFLRREPRKGEV